MQTKLSQKIKALVAQNAPTVKKRGYSIKSFANKSGFIYFGSIDRKRDDIEIIRGITASTTHHDTHYAVGSYDDYDLQIVDRFDVFYDDNRKTKVTYWMIMQADLKNAQSLPHMFLFPTAVYNPAFRHLFNAFNGLQPINSLLYDQHTPEFHNRYQLYVAPAHAAYAEKFFNKNTTQIIATHFWPHAVEVIGSKIYLYDTENITQDRLSAQLKLIAWLAETFDNIEDKG